MKKFSFGRSIVFACLALIIILSGCGPKIDTGATQTAQMEAFNVTSTSDAESTATQSSIATATQEAAIALSATAAYELELTATAEMAATKTAEAQLAKTATAEAKIAEKTAQAAVMLPLLDQMLADGAISSTAGEYIKLDDYSRAEAKIDYLYLLPTDYSPQDFVIETDITITSASDKANWYSSGCGFLIHVDDSDNFDSVFLNMWGQVEYTVMKNGRWGNDMTKDAVTFSIPSDSAHFALSYQNGYLTMYVNGVRIMGTPADANYKGGLYYTLVSGTNAGFGTMCEFTNTNLWVLD